MPSSLRAAFLAVAVVATACARGGGRDTAPEPEPAPADSASAEPASNEPVEVFIRSFHHQPVRIFIVRGATAHRLGLVAEGRGRTFTLPKGFYGRGVAMYFVFTLVGGGERFASETLSLRPGNYVEWTLARELKYSTVFIW